ncbi:MAG: hypothetical protein HUU20_23160 [Pirellulales bacterium]|nr:hypothetical protein [Pirellulales bacterium]
MENTDLRNELQGTRRRFLEAAAAAVAGGVAWEAASHVSQADETGPGKKTRSLVLYQSGDTWEEVHGETGDGKELSELGLIAKAVPRVRFQGRTYSVEREGLYRFLTLPESLRNLISLRSGESLVPLLMALSALQVHGNRQDGEATDALKKRLVVDPWVCITCGNIARLASSVLAGEGYQTRPVGASTLEEPNGYNDGHCLFEVYSPEAGKWILVDADMGLLFKAGDTFLGAEEVVKRVHEDQRPEFFVLAQKAAVLDPFFLRSDGYNYALEFRWLWGTPEGKWQWYRRVLQRIR